MIFRFMDYYCILADGIGWMQNSWAMNVGFYETFVHTNVNETIRRGISLVVETVVSIWVDTLHLENEGIL